jgi:GBP family porin
MKTIRHESATLALLAAFAVPTAHAQSSVTLYGIVDSGIGYTRVTGPTFQVNTIGMVDGVENGSRFGMMGSEDLGSGWRAGFILEGGFSVDTGALKQSGREFGRKAIVTLDSTQWGSLQLGRQSNLATKYFLTIDPYAAGFGQSTIGATFSATNVERYDDMILYQTPSYGGFSFGASYSFNVDSTVTAQNGPLFADNTRGLEAGAKYTRGPLYAVVVYDQLTGSSLPTAKIDQQATPRELSVAMTYDFKVVKLAVGYARTQDGWFATTTLPAGTPTTTAPGTAGFSASNLFASGFKANSYMVGATIPVGPQGSILAAWQMADPSNDKLTGGDKAMQIASVAYVYSLSVQTQLWAYGSYGKNYGFIKDINSTAIGVGIDHMF